MPDARFQIADANSRPPARLRIWNLKCGIWNHVLVLFALLLPAAAVAAECRALIISGDPGPEPNAAKRFENWTSRWTILLRDVYGFKPANIRMLRSPARAAKPDAIPPADFATLENVLAALSALARESKEGDQTVLILIGHGYDSQSIGKFCLVGKDLSDLEAGRALEGLKAKQFLCINTAPASMTWANALARPGRVIITATGKPGMRSQTYFCEFLLRALQPSDVAQGRLGNVTLLDAFNKASLNTLGWYQNQFVGPDGVTVHGKEFQEIWKAMYPDGKMVAGDAQPRDPVHDPEQQDAWMTRRLIAEVAGLEDNGDGTPSTILEEETKPTPLPSKSGDGELARRIILGKP